LSDKPNQREAVLLRLLNVLLEQRQRIGQIEFSVAQMGVGPVSQLEIATSPRGFDIDAPRGQSLEVIVAPFGIHGVNSLFSQVQAIFDEGNQDFVLFIMSIEKGANVSAPA
jgi:hypothetical protein